MDKTLLTGAEAEHVRRDEELKEAISDLGAALDRRLRSIEAKVDPMHEMFTSVSGFNRISIWILKLLAGLGALIGSLYAIARFLAHLGESR